MKSQKVVITGNRRNFLKYLLIIPIPWSFLDIDNFILINEKESANFKKSFFDYNGWQLTLTDIKTLKNVA